MALMRKPHVLKENKTNTVPNYVIFFDTETSQHYPTPQLMQHRLKLGCACYFRKANTRRNDSETWFDFTDEDAFWQWSLQYAYRNCRLVFIAHNLDFDFLVLNGVNALESRGWSVKNLIVSGSVDIWTFVKYEIDPKTPRWKAYVKQQGKDPRVTKTLLFIDLMNYFKMSLARLGKSIGCPKMEIDFDTCTDSQLLRYCRNDVLIMVKAWRTWCAFIEENNLGVWGKTLPSQAFNAYRHRFMPHKIYLHDHVRCCELERSGYFGGRTECFQIGEFYKGPYYLYDVNSLYPSVMGSNTFPTGMKTYIKQGSVGDIKKHIDSYGVIARVLVRIHSPCIPKRHKGRLVFPVGSFWTTLTTPELICAMNAGEILAVRDMAVYKMAPIFAEYVDFFWRQRMHFRSQGNRAYDQLCKLMLNSLYGKFGQQIDSYAELCEDPERLVGYFSEYDMDEKKWIRFKRMNGKIEVYEGKQESYNSFPAIAAHVTAYARMSLLTYMNHIEARSLYYCDTDSLIVDETGSRRLERFCNEGVLGALHLEQTSEAVRVNNVKDYVFGGKRKLKGVTLPRSNQNANTFVQWQQNSMKRVLWGQSRPGCFWSFIQKEIREGYKKGIVSDDGYVIPLLFSESA